MKCGIDVGSTLIKAVTKHGDGYMYRSTGNITRDQLIASLASHQVDEVLTTGIGTYDLPFELSATRNAHPLSEIQMQVAGVKELLLKEGKPLIEYGLVSIGTGISYTSVECFHHFHLPVGNPIGGGYLLGMGRLLISEYVMSQKPKDIMKGLEELGSEYMGDFLYQEPYPDLRYQDVSPEANGNIIGEMVVASCANLSKGSDVATIGFSLLNTVAVGIIKDLMMYKSSDAYKSNDIVCIGTASKSTALQSLLENYGSKLGLKFHFPMWREYAAALGALLKLEKKAFVENKL